VIHRALVLPGLALLAAAYFAILGGEHSVFDIRRVDRLTREEIVRLDAVRAEISSLRARADSLENDPFTLERIARERYGLIRDGERLYRFVDGDSVPASTGGFASTSDRRDR